MRQKLKPKQAVGAASSKLRFQLAKSQSLPSLSSEECYQRMPKLMLTPVK
jgi:hypothetical protein